MVTRLANEPPTVPAAISAFGREVRRVRDRLPEFVQNNEALARACGKSERTISNAVAGTHFPSKTTIVLIARACSAPELVKTYEDVEDVVDPKSPRYGQAWPAGSSSKEASAPEDDEVSPEPAAGAGTDNAKPPFWHRPVVVVVTIVVIGGGTTVAALSSVSSPPPVEPQVRFNSLGGTSTTYIEVYRGPSTSPNDKIAIGGYQNGQTALAVCKKEGRLVKSHPEDGEQERSSSTWVQLDGQLKAFATMTYADMDPTALKQLPTC